MRYIEIHVIVKHVIMRLYCTCILIIFYQFQASFTINLEDDDVSAGDIRAEVIGPDSHHNVHFNWVGRKGEGYFTPTETGLHKVSSCRMSHIRRKPGSGVSNPV